jgi:hypothetical protein
VLTGQSKNTYMISMLDRDHAMRKIQDHSIPVVQLTQLQKLFNKTFSGVQRKSQFIGKCYSAKWQHRQCRCLANKVSFSGSCSRCLVSRPLPFPNLPKQSIRLCGYGVKGPPAVQGVVPRQQHWHQVHAIGGAAGVHNSRLSMLMYSANALTSAIN